MKLKLIALAVCSCLATGAFAQQIVERTLPNIPATASDAQIAAVQQAEKQIQAADQAVALQKAKLAEKKAKAEAAAKAKRNAAQAKVKAQKEAAEAKVKAQKEAAEATKQKYRDEMKQMDLEMKKLDLEQKRSDVQTKIDLNDIAQQKAKEEMQKRLSPGANKAIEAGKAAAEVYKQ